MVKPKVQKKKQQKRGGGVDFKKIRRKIGRKLPPPKNTTNTEVKSKAIILPEQSVASEKAGLAVSNKGLTLKELLQQTCHHNAKVRKDALIGIRDLFQKHPTELKLHKLSVIEKLRERIVDDDKMVRETLYQLLKAVIFPCCQEDNQGPFISLMMAYIFNAMIHLAIDVRLMAFKFCDLVVQFYPASFSVYAEKILENYKDFLRKNQSYLQEKGKLKTALNGLASCMSLLMVDNRGDHSHDGNDVSGRKVLHAFDSDIPRDPSGSSSMRKELIELLPVLVGCFQDCMSAVHTVPQLDTLSFDCVLSILESVDYIVKFFCFGTGSRRHDLQLSNSCSEDQAVLAVTLKKLFEVFPVNPAPHLSEKDVDRYFILNTIVSKVFLSLSEWVTAPSHLMRKYLEFIRSALFEICSSARSEKAFRQKHSLSLIPFIPKLMVQVEDSWKSHILQAFTEVFKQSNPDSSMKFACLSAIEEMLVPKHGWVYLNTNDPGILDFQIDWIRELPPLLTLLSNESSASFGAVLRIQLSLGKCALVNPSLLVEYDNMQYALREFYSTCIDGNICYGPFMRLTRDIQELAICCLYYFSSLDQLLLQSLSFCCLCSDLEPSLLFRLLEVLQSAYRAGHILTADYVSFLITLLSCYHVGQENDGLSVVNRGKYVCGSIKSITSVVCSYVSQLGDNSLVFKVLEKTIVNQISINPPLENICALLRLLATLDAGLTNLSEHSIAILGDVLPRYLINVASFLTDEDRNSILISDKSRNRYCLLPCFHLFYWSKQLMNLVLSTIGTLNPEKLSTLELHGDNHSRRITAIVSLFRLMHSDTKMRHVLLSCKGEIELLLRNILGLTSSEEFRWSLEERCRIQDAYQELKLVSSNLFSSMPVK